MSVPVLEFDSVMPLSFLPRPDSDVWGRTVQVESGERVFIRGSSGSGKTTLALSLAGVRKDYTGTIRFCGNEVKSAPSNETVERRRRGISFVYQDLKLFNDISGWENIAIKARLAPIHDKEFILEKAENLHIAHLLGKKCGTLSRGERQRLVILRAICQPFSLIILDEPFSHLDDANSEIASRLIEEERTANSAALVILDLEIHNRFTCKKLLFL